MRVLLLGADDRVGQATGRTLAASSELDHLTVGGIAGGPGEALAGELGPVAQPLAVDLDDRVALASLAADHDVVINARPADPADTPRIVEAAVRGRVPYVDGGRRRDVAVSLLQRSSAIARAGGTVVTGCGVAPGMTNFLAVIAARELDEVSQIHTVVGIDTGEGRNWRIDQQERELLVAEWRDILAGGHPATRLRASDQRLLHFPGVGSGNAWLTPRPEVDTLAAHFDPPGGVEALVGMRRSTAAMFLEEAPLAMSLRRRARRMIVGARLHGMGSIPVVCAITEGRRGDVGFRIGARLRSLPLGLDITSGIVLAIAGSLAANGEVEQPGVYGPETAFDADEVFAKLAPWCEPPIVDVDPVDVTLEQI